MLGAMKKKGAKKQAVDAVGRIIAAAKDLAKAEERLRQQQKAQEERGAENAKT